ncbi:hypothetical protein F3Y22_tig00110705pilonHSYRG00084 [Hibiscus syriacus]|uniref:Uncharacterized protein n=1 Tax=Hibiscus syriacus TaxID=106335 RepID=A0A6A2ZUE7_HIBSY|nr:hypothetical protein F3Y22_tig00110705pilonHSYRG00084 [Hibiscus syriacus]
MDFLKVNKLRKFYKSGPEKGLEENDVPQPEEPKNVKCGGDIDLNGSSKAESAAADVEDDNDDDFITNEVQRRLKELRRNSFMVLIPEEEEELYLEQEEAEAGETSSSEWRDVEAEGRQWWGGIDAVYEKYCERMLFFDWIIAQQIKNAVCWILDVHFSVGSRDASKGSTNLSPKFASKKLASPPSRLSLKRIEEPDALHCQYTQTQIVLCQPDSPTCYNQSAQLLQQFQVLIQRFIENEPFQDGLRAEIYARARHVLPKLLQIPSIQGLDQKAKVEDKSDHVVLASDITKIIESKGMKLKELRKRGKGGKRNPGRRYQTKFRCCLASLTSKLYPGFSELQGSVKSSCFGVKKRLRNRIYVMGNCRETHRPSFSHADCR